MDKKKQYLLSTLSVEKRLYIQSKAMECVQNGIIISDKDGYIIYANPYICQKSGYSSDELVGNHTRTFKSGNHSEEFYKNLWDTVNSGKKMGWTNHQ